jgi:hypothetical protein
MCVRLSHSTLLLLSLRRVQPVASSLDVWLLHMLATKQSEHRQSWKREISRRLRDIRLMPAGHRSVPNLFQRMDLSNGLQLNNSCYMYA